MWQTGLSSFKRECECSTGVSKHEKTDENGLGLLLFSSMLGMAAHIQYGLPET